MYMYGHSLIKIKIPRTTISQAEPSATFSMGTSNDGFSGYP